MRIDGLLASGGIRKECDEVVSNYRLAFDYPAAKANALKLRLGAVRRQGSFCVA
jgi:hypothetical protein